MWDKNTVFDTRCDQHSLLCAGLWQWVVLCWSVEMSWRIISVKQKKNICIYSVHKDIISWYVLHVLPSTCHDHAVYTPICLEHKKLRLKYNNDIDYRISFHSFSHLIWQTVVYVLCLCVYCIWCDQQWCLYYVSVCTVFDVTNSGVCILSLCVLYLMWPTVVSVLCFCVDCTCKCWYF
jgi:hypothetical protein